jgi:ABC-type transport system involved in cytochrome bd biosynthesis fused ATPase/permease subunit
MIKLTRGSNSYQERVFAHEKHFDLPLARLAPVLNLRMTTFRKLPTRSPNTMRKKYNIDSIT